MTAPAPWELDAVLQPSRLLLLAQLAVETRNQAFSEARPDLGDTSWGIGCKAHERYVHAVTCLAEGGRHDWLTVHRDGLSFTSFVEGVAIRAYRGPSDKPHHRHVHAAQLELERVRTRQLELPFFGAPDAAPIESWVWLMAVETDDAGRALRVVFFQANDAGERRHAWSAPITVTVSTGDAEGAPLAAPVIASAPARPRRRRAPARHTDASTSLI